MEQDVTEFRKSDKSLKREWGTAAGWPAGNTRFYFCAGRSQIRPVYAPGHYGDSVHYGDEYYFYFMGGHAITLPKGGWPCPLGTFNYGVVGHLAF